MNINIQSLLQECDDTISQINSQLDQISTQEQQHPELRELLDLKKQFLERIRKLLKTEVGGIRRIIQFLLYKDKKIYQFLERFKQDLETFNQYFNIRNDLNPHSLQSQLQLLRTEYEIFLKDDVELQKLLQLRRQAQDEPNKRFEDTKNKVFKIMQFQFRGLPDNIENTIFSQQGVYLFTLLYEMSESDATYEYILLSGFARGIFQVNSIQQLSPPELLQVIQKFINLRSFCQSDATYEYILRYGFSKRIFQVNSIQQLSPPELLQIIQEFINLRSSCRSDEIYRSILDYGFAQGILQVNSIQQLSPPELLQIISQFGQQLINLQSFCRSDETYRSILLSGFAAGIFQVNSIQQLSPPELLQVIQKFINLRSSCQSDATYEYILNLGFVRGILQVNSIQQLSPPELLQVIQKFINLRSSCRSDEIYRNILDYGFAQEIFQVNSIQQLSPSELLQIIQEFINLRSFCRSDEIYRIILFVGFARGIFEVNSIQQLSPPELLQIISQFGQQFINLQSSCQSDEIRIILFWGFRNGIFQVNSIQQLSPSELLEAIPQFAERFIKLQSLTQNAFKHYIEIIIKILQKESDLENQINSLDSLIELCEKLRVESYPRFEFVSQLPQPYSQLIRDEDFNTFISKAKVLIKSEYEMFKLSPDKSAFFENQGKRLQEIFEGDLQEEISDQLIGLIRYVFYPNDQTRTFNQYKQNILNWEDRNNDIPEPIRDFNISTTLKGVEHTLKNFKSSNSEEENKAFKAIFEPYSSAHRTITQSNTNPSTKEHILSQLLNLLHFGFKTRISELEQNKDFISQKNNLFLLIYSYINSNQVEFMHSLESEFEEKYEIVYKYITYLNDTLLDIFRDLFEEEDYHNIRNTPIFQRIQADLIEKVNRINNKNGRDKFRSANKLDENNNLTKEGICHQLILLFFRNDSKRMEEYVKFRFDIKKSKNKTLTLKLSKKKLHACALMNFGVCTSQDTQLWNSPDFWQLLIFDEQSIAHGGVMIRQCEINSRKYLAICINPTNRLLSCVKSEELYLTLIRTCGVIAKKIGFSGVVIPTPKNLYSNRSQIHSIVKSKNYQITRISNPSNYTYNPTYSYDSVYIISLSFWKRLFK